jgi:hypothetical protein
MTNDFMVYRTFRYWLVAGLAALIFLMTAPGLHAAQIDPFKTLLGSWKGNGTFSLSDGTRERISCNAYYTGGGSQLRLAILCASSNNKIHMRGKLSLSRGRLSGSWEERTYNAEGRLSGKATSNRLTMAISGNVTGSMIVSYSRKRQSVQIKTTGSLLKTVTVRLSR